MGTNMQICMSRKKTTNTQNLYELVAVINNTHTCTKYSVYMHRALVEILNYCSQTTCIAVCLTMSCQENYRILEEVYNIDLKVMVRRLGAFK